MKLWKFIFIFSKCDGLGNDVETVVIARMTHIASSEGFWGILFYFPGNPSQQFQKEFNFCKHV